MAAALVVAVAGVAADEAAGAVVVVAMVLKWFLLFLPLAWLGCCRFLVIIVTAIAVTEASFATAAATVEAKAAAQEPPIALVLVPAIAGT